MIWVSNLLVLLAKYAAAEMETINACILTTTCRTSFELSSTLSKQSEMKGKRKEDPAKIYGDLKLNIQLARTVTVVQSELSDGEKWCNLDDLVKRDNWWVPGDFRGEFIFGYTARVYILLRIKV